MTIDEKLAFVREASAVLGESPVTRAFAVLMASAQIDPGGLVILMALLQTVAAASVAKERGIPWDTIEPTRAELEQERPRLLAAVEEAMRDSTELLTRRDIYDGGGHN